ncbi:RNA polymerase sigma-54 factor [Slackia equolifaciens]|uniref:RNA polymerase sigma-54 factor n=1 Tax=Slackia equolifaciens TaxID=498718 RepID=A0A3N0AVN6_9ACTN|nr:RNA polymerase factor sigma-54 [Slackia equolifaciens]RNL38748.1 RNA polymerase sigma-54 factor [Slackia equolifaciens]
MAKASLEMQASSRATVKAKTKTTLAPMALQGLEILSLPVSSLPDYISKAAEANPLLEVNYDDNLLAFAEMPSEDSYEDMLEQTERADNQELSELRRKHAEGRLPGLVGDWDFSRIQDDCIETETLREYLHLQASCLGLPHDAAALVEAIIEGISDDGYYTGDVGVVAFEHGVELADVDRALEIVQGIQPAGVGARSLSECLELQIDARDPNRDALTALVRDHLQDLAENRLGHLAKTLGVGMGDMLEFKRIVLEMNPRPGAAFYQKADARYIVPDLIVQRHGARLTVEVAGALERCLTLNADYVSLMESKGLDVATRTYLAEKREEADRLLRNLDHRSRTLERFGAFLVERQFKFFLMGGGALAPMNMQQAADALGVHVSTISRTVQGKYVQTPWGTFPLKMFFTRALPRSDAGEGAGVSSFEIKQMIKRIVEEEDKQRPLSDAKITEALNERGVEIKRRTVAKYRESLGIESQARRRWTVQTGADD